MSGISHRARGVAALLFVCVAAVSLSVSNAGAEPLELLRLQSMSVKAIRLFKAGDTSTALALATDVSNEARQVFGANHIRYAQALNNLAIFHDEAGIIDRAEELYREAIIIVEKQQFPDGLQLAELHNNLAAVVLQQCKSTDALALYRRALDATQLSLGGGHHDTRLIRDNVERLERYLRQPVPRGRQPSTGQVSTAPIKASSEQIDSLLLRCMS